MKRFVILLFALLAMASAGAAEKKEKAQKRTVYVFGFSASMLDSVAYITDIQRLDTATILPHGLLADRGLYSLQMQHHLEGQMQRSNDICVVFYNQKKAKLEKTYAELRKKYRDNERLHVSQLGVDQFHFVTEEYIPTDYDQLRTTANNPYAKSKKKKKVQNAGGLFKK